MITPTPGGGVLCEANFGTPPTLEAAKMGRRRYQRGFAETLLGVTNCELRNLAQGRTVCVAARDRRGARKADKRRM